MSLNLAAGRGVTQVIDRCESAKESKFLDLSYCQLMYIADAVYMLLKEYTIDKVSIQGNSLKKFPKKMVLKFPETTVFNMEGNEIQEIPEDVKMWKCLKGINAANNSIESFPEVLFDIPELIYIDLSGNSIKDLDVDKLLKGLPKLTQLNLCGNPLNEKSLKDLQLKKNDSLQITF